MRDRQGWPSSSRDVRQVVQVEGRGSYHGSLASVADVRGSIPAMTTIAAPPAGGNTGIVPPWLQDPPRILPMPPGWEPEPTTLAFTIVEGRVRFGRVDAVAGVLT